ncbi:uncharacterized protein LOC105833202 [Monomorium pharaonis]|uniref:uncharacterized protein LOC105833202 n=1 Tax=Monomorium pharaonis TaxID=307658 RepID=UPI00063EF2E0|nr:uncharacterized protein LOC105833202 [Monomorium pharaonis]XP_012530204.1 uncharacterized protein LOC105833202 [Monomorium pharaonis]
MLITYFWNNWKYSNAPEGKQPFEKIVGLTKYGFAASLGVGIYDSILLSQTAGFWSTANCLSYWVVPVTAMCATFASVAYTTTKLRGKDGYLSYILASLATGGICYRWQKDGKFAYQFTVILLALSAIKKYGDLNNWNPLPIREKDVRVRQQFTTFPWDFTLVKDPRGRRPWE